MLLGQLKLKVVLMVAMRILEKEIELFPPTTPPPSFHGSDLARKFFTLPYFRWQKHTFLRQKFPFNLQKKKAGRKHWEPAVLHPFCIRFPFENQVPLWELLNAMHVLPPKWTHVHKHTICCIQPQRIHRPLLPFTWVDRSSPMKI